MKKTNHTIKTEIKLIILNFLKQNNYHIEKLFKPQKSNPENLEDYVVKKDIDNNKIIIELSNDLDLKLKKYDRKIVEETLIELLYNFLEKVKILENKS